MRAGAWFLLVLAMAAGAWVFSGGGARGQQSPVSEPRSYSSFSADDILPGAPSPDAPRTVGERSVIGADERLQITDTTVYPWRAIAYLALYDTEGNEVSGCSGTFVGPNVLLTAAHCLWDPKSGFTADIAVVPGRDAGFFPYGFVWADTWVVPNGYIDSGASDSNYDYGLVKLADGTLGQTVGWFVVSHLLTGTLNRPDFTPAIAGYPGDKPEGTMWAGLKEQFSFVDSQFLDYTIDTFGGQSGSAVFSADTDSPFLGHIAGVHILGGETANTGRRANMELFLSIYDMCVEFECSLATFLEGVGLQDGGFEIGSPSASWSQFSSNFGAVICSLDTCGEAGAHSGDWWVWFGGYDNKVEQGLVEQALTIPEDVTTLSFYLRIAQSSGSGDDFMQLSLDGELLLAVGDGDAASFPNYERVDIDVSDWADGLVHRLRFDSQTNGGGAATSFYVDSLTLGAGPISTPTSTVPPTETPDTPTATPSSTPDPGDGIEVFEGWNPVRDWSGPQLQSEDPGDDEISDYLNSNMDPPAWMTVARYDGGFWSQRFKEAPLPAFQTLDVVRPGDDLWLFVSDRAVLSVP
jgi:V8-like Glu-specific endopeptidase